MAYDTVFSTPEFTVTQNSDNGKRAVEFNVTLDDGSPFTVIVPEKQVSTLFESINQYLTTK